MKTRDIMSRAWEIARKSALRWGGPAIEYIKVKGGAVAQAYAEASGAEKIEQTWKKQDVKDVPVTKTRVKTITKWVEVPIDQLPEIPYRQYLKGTEWVGPGTQFAYPGEYSFWLMNHGRGDNITDSDNLSFAAYKEWEDGFDKSTKDAWDEFNFLIAETLGVPQSDITYDNGLILQKIETQVEETYTVTERYIVPRSYYGWKDEDE